MKGKDPLEFRNDFRLALNEDKFNMLVHVFSGNAWPTDYHFKNAVFLVLEGRYPRVDLPEKTDVIYLYKERRNGQINVGVKQVGKGGYLVGRYVPLFQFTKSVQQMTFSVSFRTYRYTDLDLSNRIQYQ